MFTALHRYLGDPSGELTEDMIDRAIEQQVREAHDLDWKSELPPLGSIPNSDFPKDVAAMANSGGGTLVFGVTETGKAASGRKDTGELTEQHERGLRSAAVTAISPPLFGLHVVRLGEGPVRSVVVVVPASADGPHLIYRNDYFGAPVRNDADTVWMKERQVEAMYRARFDERRRSTDALGQLYAEAAGMQSPDSPAWVVAVAHPRLPSPPTTRPDQYLARLLLEEASAHALVYVGRESRHPLEDVDRSNPRPGLRRWTARPMIDGTGQRAREAWFSIHDDGSVSLAAAVGGRRRSSTDDDGDHVVGSRALEVAIADFMGLLRAVSAQRGLGEYEVKIGIEWSTPERLQILTTDSHGFSFSGSTVPLPRYVPIEVTVRADADDVDFYWQVHDLALDCVNQGGIAHVQTIRPPDR